MTELRPPPLTPAPGPPRRTSQPKGSTQPQIYYQFSFSQDFCIDHLDRRNRVYRDIRSYWAEVARIIRVSQEAGQIDQEVDPEAASVMFLGVVQPSAILWHMSDGDFDVTRQAQRAWPLFQKAIQERAVGPAGKANKGREGEQK